MPINRINPWGHIMYGNITPSADNIYRIGSGSKRLTDIYQRRCLADHYIRTPEVREWSAGAGITFANKIILNSNELQNVKHKACNVTSGVASASGTAGVYGTALTISPLSGYYGLLPFAVKLSCTAITAGTTLTVRITANRDDGTSASVTHDFTATGDYWLTEDEIATLIKDSCAITSFDVDVKSTGTGTTTDQGTATIVGRYT